jgi:hypothetical protein
MGRAPKPANRSLPAPARSQAIGKRASQVFPEPAHQISYRSVFVIRQNHLIEQFESSTEQARRNMRVFVDLSADKAQEHKFIIDALPFVE